MRDKSASASLIRSGAIRVELFFMPPDALDLNPIAFI